MCNIKANSNTMSIEGSSKGGSQILELESGGNHGLLKSNDDDYFSGNALVRTMVLFTMATLACLVLLINQGILPFAHPFFLLSNSFTFSFSRVNNAGIYQGGNEELGLDKILKNVAMPDKTVIISPLNKAWIEQGSVFDLFLESFRVGNQTVELLKHLMVVALDQKAFDHCLKLSLHCYYLVTEGVDFSREAGFMSVDYLKIVWRKIDFLRIVLGKGYNFVFTDADIMWFQNPFPRFYPNTDFQVTCDLFLGNHSDLNNRPNTGLMYVKSSNQTVEFFKYWYRSREIYPAKHDQDAFNIIKKDPFVREVIRLEIKFLDTTHFGGFCQSSRNFKLVYTMHANCCVGLDHKIHDLKILLEEWRKYLALPENVRKIEPPSWRVPQVCGSKLRKNETKSA